MIRTARLSPLPRHCRATQSALRTPLFVLCTSLAACGSDPDGAGGSDVTQPMPSATGATDPTPPPGPSGAPASPAASTPDVTDPGTTDPGMTDPGMTDPGMTDPGATDPGMTDPGMTPADGEGNPSDPPAEEPPQNPSPEGKACAASYGPIGKELTDPTCTDGKYCEELPDISGDLSGLFDGLRSANSTQEKEDAIVALLNTSYPFGAEILAVGGDDCLNEWLTDSQTQSFDTITQMQVAVHECGHGMDFDIGYQPSAGTVYPMPTADYFARNELVEDQFHNVIPDAKANNTYFTPGPGSGNQGIITTLSEWSQYTHDLAMVYMRSKDAPQTGFYIENAFNFSWAMVRYLVWGREHHPADYEAMLADENIREIILALWGQSILYWDANEQDTSWTPGPEHTRYLDAMRDPILLDMMNTVRKTHGCAGID